MKSYSEEELSEYFQGNDYNIAKSHNARWLDQKCAVDVVTIVADCIMQYAEDKPTSHFRLSISGVTNIRRKMCLPSSKNQTQMRK